MPLKGVYLDANFNKGSLGCFIVAQIIYSLARMFRLVAIGNVPFKEFAKRDYSALRVLKII